MKFSAVVGLVCAGAVSGFQLPVAARTSTVLQASSAKAASGPSLESIGGYGVETGNKPFDPLKIADWIPADRLRASELANGRVAMLAIVGWAFPEIFGKFAADDVQSTHALEALEQAATAFWAQLIVLCGIVEVNQFRHYQDKNEYAFFDPLNLYPKDSAGQEKMRLAELKNGRGAMIVFAAFLAHDLIPGSVPFWPFPW